MSMEFWENYVDRKPLNLKMKMKLDSILNIYFVPHSKHTPSLGIFYVLLTVHLSIFISVIGQFDAQNFCFTISLFHASTCF